MWCNWIKDEMTELREINQNLEQNWEQLKQMIPQLAHKNNKSQLSDYDKELLILGESPRVPLHNDFEKGVLTDDKNIFKVNQMNQTELSRISSKLRPISSMLNSKSSVDSLLYFLFTLFLLLMIYSIS